MLLELELRAEPLDEPAGASLLAAFVEEIAGRYPGWDPTVGPSAAPHEFVASLGRFFVAYLGDQPVGCGGVKRIDPDTAEIKRLYVAPQARGAGIARGILSALEGAAEELGYRAVRLDTGDRQPEALALFRACGYREIPDYNANPYASFWFEKPLDSRA